MSGAVEYRRVSRELADLEPGYRGERLSFSWRPYAERKPDHRADFDRLIVSIYHHGILRPLVTYRDPAAPPGRIADRVLIGMRRWEIGLRLNLGAVECVEILENVRDWHGADLPRLKALAAAFGSTDY